MENLAQGLTFKSNTCANELARIQCILMAMAMMNTAANTPDSEPHVLRSTCQLVEATTLSSNETAASQSARGGVNYEVAFQVNNEFSQSKSPRSSDALDFSSDMFDINLMDLSWDPERLVPGPQRSFSGFVNTSPL